MLAAVVGFALVCSAISMRCDFLQFFVNHPTQHSTPCKSDFAYKIPMLVLNSAINPFAYAFFKRDIKGGIWLHFEPKFVTDCEARKTPAILCIFIEFFMQIDQP